MTLENILSEKRVNNLEIKTNFGLTHKYKPLGLVKLSNKNLIENLIDGLENLGAGFVIIGDFIDIKNSSNNIIITNEIKADYLSGFDFILSDDNLENITLYSSKGITPIILRVNHLGNILKEFNPLKNEGNSFLYDESNEWSIFYSLVRYLENYKFPYDNKNLVKNVLNI